jgi:FG-GAP-like repeat
MRLHPVVSIGLAAMLAGCSRAPEKVIKPGMALAEADRVFIANVESRGLVLNRRGFPSLTAAIRSGDAKKLAAFFAPEFSGEMFAGTEGGGVQAPTLTVQRRTMSDEGRKMLSANASEFAGMLTGLRGKFGAETEVELALTSLSPKDRAALDGAWSAACALRIAGKLADGRVGELMAKLELKLKSVPDADAIATAGGWIQSVRLAEEQFAAAAAPLMGEIGGERGVNRWKLHDNWTEPLDDRPVLTGGVFVADVNNDGEDDLFVTDVSGPALYLGLGGGRFRDAVAGSGIPASLHGSGAAALADFDSDGHVDIILPRQILRGTGTGKFEDVTSRMKFEFGHRVSGFSVADYDCDGRIDLYVSRFHGTDKSVETRSSWIDGPGGPGNQLWRNLGDWKFEEVSDKANARAGKRAVFTSVWLDVNDDRWPDVYVINELGGGILLVNNGDGTFREVHLIDGDPGDFGSMGMAVGDYNNDGRVDIYTANMYSKAGRRIMENLPPDSYPPEVMAKMKRFVTGSELYRNDGGLKFSAAGKAARVHAVGWAYGAAFVDLDNDGFLDLYAAAGFASVNKEEPDG